MLQVMFCLFNNCWNSSLVYWLPWSEWCISAAGLPLRHMAINSASLTIRDCMVSLIDQPTMRRDYRSIAAAA